MTVEKVREMPRKPLSGIEVLIVGGGLGGLAAAVECFRKGHDVTVLEAKPEIEGYGAVHKMQLHEMLMNNRRLCWHWTFSISTISTVARNGRYL